MFNSTNKITNYTLSNVTLSNVTKDFDELDDNIEEQELNILIKNINDNTGVNIDQVDQPDQPDQVDQSNSITNNMVGPVIQEINKSLNLNNNPIILDNITLKDLYVLTKKKFILKCTATHLSVI